MSIFDFSDISICEETIRRTWEDFRSALAAGAFSYNELDSAKANTKFFKGFDDLFSHSHRFFDTAIEGVLSPSTTLVRAGRLRPADPEPTYGRFIPDKKYITKHNRFSPPEVEWLYLAIGDSWDANNCALKECRAAEGELFGLCQFKLNEKYLDRKLVDLTIADKISHEEINNELEGSANEIRIREEKKAIKSIILNGYTTFPDISEIKEKITKWAALTYARLLSEQIFIPVDTEDKELMYSPFQCMAHYFFSLGYEGIVYSSTVFPEGKNVVLFDKDAAIPFGKIKILTI